MQTTGMNLRNVLSKNALDKKSTWCIIPFTQSSRPSSQSYSEKEIRMFVSHEAYWGLPGKRHDRIFWSDDNILYLDASVGYASLYICQNS